MFSLTPLLLFKPFHKQGGASMEKQNVKTGAGTAKVKRVMAHLLGASSLARPPEEWQRLEGKKQIKTSEQVRAYLGNH